MIEIMIGIVIILLLTMSIAMYYSCEYLKNQDLEKEGEKKTIALKKVLKKIFKLKKKDYIVLVIQMIVCIATYIISHYVYNHNNIFWTYRWMIAIGILIPIAVIDFKEKIIPNKLLLIGLAYTVVIISVQVIMQLEYISSVLGNSFIGLLFGGGIFFIASVVVKNGVGAGDIKMFILYGFLLAFRGIFNVLLYSMVISAVCGIVLILIKKKNTKDELPLAPFTLIGVIVSIMFGV